MNTKVVPLGALAALAMAVNAAAPAAADPANPSPRARAAPAAFPLVALPPGYRIEKVVGGLTYPTSLAWDGRGRLRVLEAGGQFLDEPPPARLLRISRGRARIVARLTEGDRRQGRRAPSSCAEGPCESRRARGAARPGTGVAASAVGLAYHRDAFYFTHRDAQTRTGAVSRVNPRTGQVTRVFDGILDSQSEHQVNDIKVGPDGRMYVASGPGGNSAVMGLDNAPFIERSPGVHATACRDIVLTGQNFRTPDFRTRNPTVQVLTGAFQPFGRATRPGQRVEGRSRCGGAILSFDPDNPRATLRPFADGLRNVIGITFNRRGEMFAAVNGYDVRGSRPVNDVAEPTYRLQRGHWYGFPDFSAALDPLALPQFDSPDPLQAPQFIGRRMLPMPRRLLPVIDLAASGLRAPDKRLVAGLHENGTSPSMLDVAPDSFGFGGQLFVAEWGDLAPGTSPLRPAPTGYRITRIDPAVGGMAVPFAANRTPGPASELGLRGRGLERPFDVKFGPDGAMYIADYGIGRVNLARLRRGQVPYEFPPRSGAIWPIVRAG